MSFCGVCWVRFSKACRTRTRSGSVARYNTRKAPDASLTLISLNARPHSLQRLPVGGIVPGLDGAKLIARLGAGPVRGWSKSYAKPGYRPDWDRILGKRQAGSLRARRRSIRAATSSSRTAGSASCSNCISGRWRIALPVPWRRRVKSPRFAPW